ncbi:MAG TPA: AAA family ATPase [Spirochaetia bacterium]|nr:AAA family ATPase [Spirochaetia bacterium]
MILSRLRIHPFGFFSDKEIRFTPGLNVVLGPNEAGKSTIFSAIKSSLLRSQLRKPEFDKLMARHLPAGGGDIARLELEFTTSSGVWVLKRQWGAGARSELHLPDGGVLADDEAIREKLQDALPVRQATFWKVLMTGQAELGKTVESLRTDSAGAVSDLTDILRRTVLETGGIPVDAFRGLLAERQRGTFQHWDDVHKGPEAGRGIERPWKKEVGTILAAWYSRESARVEHARALEYETALDLVNGRLRAAEQATATVDAFLAANRKAEQDARNRRVLEAQMQAIQLEQRELHAVSREWPVAENRAREIRRTLEELGRSKAPLEAETQEARIQEEGRALREKHVRVARRKAQLEEARALASSAQTLSRQDLEGLRTASQTAAALKASVEAGKLTMTAMSTSDVEVVVQEDFGPQKTERIARGESMTLRAGGRIKLVSPQIEIEVRSGDAGALEAARKEGEAAESLQRRLAQLGVANVEEAEERVRVAEAHAAAVRAAESNLREELGGKSERDLEAAVAALGPARTVRSLAECSAELARLQASSEALSRELRVVSSQLEAWAERFGTLESAVDRLAAARGRDQEVSRELLSCAPLPEGFADTQSFLRAYDTARDESKRRAEEKARYADEKRDLEKRSPEQSSEELAQILAAADKDFAGASRTGQAITRISKVTDELLGESDTAVIAGMRAALEPLIGSMSRGRHAGVVLDGSLPRGLADNKGRALGWELLSGGTRDMLALALRLAMASFFLQSTDGFLMLDDPLSEMDPDRQKAAALALRSFARDKQLIAFTCHPASADMMGGNLICL